VEYPSILLNLTIPSLFEQNSVYDTTKKVYFYNKPQVSVTHQRGETPFQPPK